MPCKSPRCAVHFPHLPNSYAEIISIPETWKSPLPTPLPEEMGFFCLRSHRFLSLFLLEKTLYLQS